MTPHVMARRQLLRVCGIPNGFRIPLDACARLLRALPSVGTHRLCFWNATVHGAALPDSWTCETDSSK